MYRDNTLVPSEAVRLTALGILAEADKHYAELAAEVRHFTSRIAGPSLDLVAAPLELLKVEGLVEAIKGDADNALLRITEDGRSELSTLMTSNVRAPVNDINKLIIALKMRFLHLLPVEDQKIQIEVMMEMAEREIARLSDLRQHHASSRGHLVAWLDQDIAAAETRLAWLQELLADLDRAPQPLAALSAEGP